MVLSLNMLPLTSAQMRRARVINSTIHGNISAKNVEGERSIWSGSTLQGSNFNGSNLRRSNFSSAKINFSSFRACDITNGNFTGTNASNSFFMGSYLWFCVPGWWILQLQH